METKLTKIHHFLSDFFFPSMMHILDYFGCTLLTTSLFRSITPYWSIYVMKSPPPSLLYFFHSMIYVNAMLKQ